VFDVHYHLVFGVDDGPKCIEDSLALIEASIDEGVTHIVATPHANHKYSFEPEINRARLESIRERVDGRITLGLGCDFHMSFDNIQCLQQHTSRYTVNGKRYLLVEFADFILPRESSNSLFKIRAAGVIPVITHPERNPMLMSEPQRVREWVEAGCLVQITAASLCGDFGSKSQSMATELLRKNLVHVVASDAHSVKWRAPAMRRAYDVLIKEFGKETADRLCVENPRAIFFGERLPPQPELVASHNGKRSFLGRFLGK
jgi:protein-tyrosine phosphatase